MNLRALRRVAAVTAVSGALVVGLVSTASASTTVSYAQWQSDVTAVTTPALTYVQQRIVEASSTSDLAIVLDIDNTSLASYFYPSTYPTPADPPVLALAQYAASKGVKIFFISARTDLIDLVTEYNLTAVGYTVNGLYSRNVIQLLEPIQTFKTAEREQLESEGYDIIANIGNNTTDLEGGYADSTWKLPDYDGLLD